MNVLTETMPGMDEASAELDRLIAEDLKAEAGGQKAEDGTEIQDGDSATAEAQRAEQAALDAQGTNERGNPAPNAADAAKGKTDDATQAKAEAAKKAAEAKPGEAKAGDESKSRYGKAQARLQGGWLEHNAAKTALQTEQTEWKKQQDAERAQLLSERKEFDAQRNKAEAEHPPEAYDQAAKKFEAEGKFDLADLAKAKAEALRKNPPLKASEKSAAASKEWALKAGTDFPELVKQNSGLQMRVAQLLKDEPDFKAHPKGIYVAARIADLENQAAKSKTALASVAEKDVELGKLRNRITELEQLTAPGGGGGVTKLPGTKGFAQKSSDEQLAELSDDLANVVL